MLTKRLENFETQQKQSAQNICKIKYDTRRFTKIISQAISTYDNILIAGDLIIDVPGSKGLIDDHFTELIDTFNLTNSLTNFS